MAVRADERQDASDSAQQATNAWRREADERLDALINAQVRYEARQERLEEAFRQVASSHAQLVEMLQLHEDRLDGQDEAALQTDSRLDALIDAQIQLTHQVDTLTGDIAALNGRAAATDERLDRMAEKLDRTTDHLDLAVAAIDALVEAQARTDKQIRMLLDRNGATKSGRKSTKAAKKMTGKAKRN